MTYSGIHDDKAKTTQSGANAQDMNRLLPRESANEDIAKVRKQIRNLENNAMLEQNHGHIVNIASVAGVVGTNKMTDYCASKFGNVGFTESLEYELRASGKNVKTTTDAYFTGKSNYKINL